MGRQLQEACREFDSVARYGGEEFAVVLPRTDTEEALIVAHRMRQVVKELSIGPPVTVSAGVATFPVDGIEAALPLLPAEISGLAMASDYAEHPDPLPRLD